MARWVQYLFMWQSTAQNRNIIAYSAWMCVTANDYTPNDFTPLEA